MKLTNNEVRDEIERILEKASYAHGMLNLITAQKDFNSQPKHQQTALFAVGDFSWCVISALEELRDRITE